MGKNVEETRRILEADLKDCPYILSDPLGHAITYQKIKDYLFTCVVTGEDRVNCKDWLYKLYDGQTDDEKAKLQSRVDLLANGVYDFYAYTQKLSQNCRQ